MGSLTLQIEYESIILKRIEFLINVNLPLELILILVHTCIVMHFKNVQINTM
ncbi:hypothetical protein SEEN176_12088 [Salmonella enterica subsp. enterica serovar Newport str. CVM 4176]|nr:hypothetical protein SEEN176_12088 [Salmonella enterica subsp. enterica serovar Newport str. CVM 4176]